MTEFKVTFYWENGTKTSVKVNANTKEEAIERGLKYPFIAPNGNYEQTKAPNVRETRSTYIG